MTRTINCARQLHNCPNCTPMRDFHSNKGMITSYKSLMFFCQVAVKQGENVINRSMLLTKHAVEVFYQE